MSDIKTMDVKERRAGDVREGEPLVLRTTERVDAAALPARKWLDPIYQSADEPTKG